MVNTQHELACPPPFPWPVSVCLVKRACEHDICLAFCAFHWDLMMGERRCLLRLPAGDLGWRGGLIGSGGWLRRAAGCRARCGSSGSSCGPSSTEGPIDPGEAACLPVILSLACIALGRCFWSCGMIAILLGLLLGLPVGAIVGVASWGYCWGCQLGLFFQWFV